MQFGKVLLILLLLTLTGCGVDWFPEYKQLPTDPNPFSFTTQNNATPGAPATSNSITVQGLKADSTTISVSDTTSSGSMYSINGGAYTSANGTVKNGDTVTVQHTASSIPGGSVTTTLTIGNVVGTFTSVASSTASGFNVTNTTTSGSLPFAQVLTLPTGSYNITITGNGSYSFNINGPFNDPTPFTIVSGVTIIYLKNFAPGTTTLTFNGIVSTYTTTIP